MKKVLLLVAVFLLGSTTQTFANHQKNVIETPGITDRCANLQSIRFVEQGILYTVMTNGDFEFEVIGKSKKYRKRGRNNQWDTYSSHGRKNRGHNKYQPCITWDRFGRIRSVNDSQITYQRNGKVRSIGSVPLHYQRGQLMQVGNMDIIYNRFGEIRSTLGYVNSFNRRFWHENWYVYNDRDFKPNHSVVYGDRVRNKRK